MNVLLADFDLSRLTDRPWMLVLYGLLLLGGFVAGYVVTAVVLRGVMLVLFRTLSHAAVFRLRFTGGLMGAIAALFVGFGGGFGFGPGAGGAPAESGSLAEQSPSSSTAPSRASMSLVDPLEPPRAEVGPLRVLLLGERTAPPGAQPDGFFAFPDDPSPQAVNLEAVMKRVLERKSEGLKEVQLLVSRDPPSVLLEHPVVTAEGGLRERVLKEAQLPFVQPDPEEPFSGRTIRYNPAGSKNSPQG